MAAKVMNMTGLHPSLSSSMKDRMPSAAEAVSMYQQCEARDLHREAAEAWREEPRDLNENEIEAVLRNALQHRSSGTDDDSSCACPAGLNDKCDEGDPESCSCACHLDPDAVMEAADRLVASCRADDEDPLTSVILAAMKDPNVQNALLQSPSVHHALTHACRGGDHALGASSPPLIPPAHDSRPHTSSITAGEANHGTLVCKKPETSRHFLSGVLRNIDAFCSSLSPPPPPRLPPPRQSTYGMLQDPSGRQHRSDEDSFMRMVLLVVAAILVASRIGGHGL